MKIKRFFIIIAGISIIPLSLFCGEEAPKYNLRGEVFPLFPQKEGIALVDAHETYNENVFLTLPPQNLVVLHDQLTKGQIDLIVTILTNEHIRSAYFFYWLRTNSRLLSEAYQLAQDINHCNLKCLLLDFYQSIADSEKP